MESRGLTLRSKSRRVRPLISAPKPISNPLPLNSTAESPIDSSNASRERPQQRGATSDLVKKRYSARFNQAPDFDVSAPPVPALPSEPVKYMGKQVPPRPSTAPGQRLTVDKEALIDPDLQADRYVAEKLASATEEEINEYRSELRKLKNRTSTNLQQNVYQNRTQFIKISKEADKLKAEMRTLRSLMTELTGALDQATIGHSIDPVPLIGEDQVPKRNANRSSVANLENMWNIQLQTLWKTVEGSQKFLPAVPGRHIVLETGYWAELDPATWKPRRPVHLVLLNDHILVAAKKKKRVDQVNQNYRGPVPTKLVAEECWPLQDVDMIDLATHLGTGLALDEAVDRGITNAISIRVAGGQFTYRHDKRDSPAKAELLATFRKTVEDLRRALRSETDTTMKPNDMRGYRMSSSFSLKADQRDLDWHRREKAELWIDVDGKQQNLRWIEGQVDDLDIAIALQRFGEAVSNIERLRKVARDLKGNSIAQDAISSKVDERAAKLASVLLRALVDTHSFPNATKTNVTWLTRLGFEDSAREAYLQARSDVMSKRIRACVFEGDLPLYIFQVSFVYFTLVKNTISIYQQCFPAAMSSASIKWAKLHLDDFNILLTRQLSSVQRGTSVWHKCMNIVREYAGLLAKVGIDFTELVTRGLEDEDEHGEKPMTRSEELISGSIEEKSAMR